MLLSSAKSLTLSTYRPTPTTISFTVSTRAPIRSVTARVAFYASVILRLILGILIVSIFSAKWRAGYPVQDGSRDQGAHDSILANTLSVLVSKVEWMYLLPGGIVGLWAAVRRGYVGMWDFQSRAFDMLDRSASNVPNPSARATHTWPVSV